MYVLSTGLRVNVDVFLNILLRNMVFMGHVLNVQGE